MSRSGDGPARRPGEGGGEETFPRVSGGGIGGSNDSPFRALCQYLCHHNTCGVAHHFRRATSAPCRSAHNSLLAQQFAKNRQTGAKKSLKSADNPVAALPRRGLW